MVLHSGKLIFGTTILQTHSMKSILLIEDNNDILENLIEYLEMFGYKILSAKNGKTGIELAKTFKPDLIICDVLMPEMDGHEVLRLLIESELTCNIPFIFSTSVCEKYDRTEALKLGADDYIIKPFDMEVFLQMIEKWTNSDIPNMHRNRNCMV